MNPTSVMIVAKREGLILPCFPRVEPDGYSWTCPACPTIVARVSYGLMNGLWRCECGAEIEVCVGGKVIDIKHVTALALRHNEEVALQEEVPVNVIPFPKRITTRDKEFLEACNIALDDDGDEPA